MARNKGKKITKRINQARKILGLGHAKKSVIVAAIRERYRDAPAGSADVCLAWFLQRFSGAAGVVSRPKTEAIRRADPFLESYAWRQLRMKALIQQGRRCLCCGATPGDGKTVLHVDHIKPRRLFPELALELSNLQVLCDVCNHGKGNWDQTDWRPSVPPVPPLDHSVVIQAPPPEPVVVLDPMKPRLVKREA